MPRWLRSSYHLRTVLGLAEHPRASILAWWDEERLKLLVESHAREGERPQSPIANLQRIHLQIIPKPMLHLMRGKLTQI